MSLIPPSHTMFVIDLHYAAPLEEIDPLIDAHVAFLEDSYTAGRFLASGPKIPRTGGVIIAVSDSRETLEASLQNDPFHKHGVAEYRITEFRPSMRALQLDG